MLRLSAAPTKHRDAPRVPVLPVALGQLLSWGTLYYGIAFLAQPISQDTGWRLAEIFGAFSVSLLVAALMAVPVGRLLVKIGGRTVMTAGSLLAFSAFLLMASSRDLPLFYAGWILAGVAMSMTLYEAAFSTLRESAGPAFRKAIGLITIVGGLASTLFWPLTHWLVLEIGWRMTAMVFAGTHLLVGVPLHRMLPRKPVHSDRPTLVQRSSLQPVSEKWLISLLALSFALASLVTSAISSHVVVLLSEIPISGGQMVLLVSLIGPMQVAGRIVEIRLSHRFSVLATGRVALIGIAISLLALYSAVGSPWLAWVFVILYGATNGVLTVVRGGAPAELLDHSSYASALAMLSAPALAARAAGPLVAAAAANSWGPSGTTWLLFLVALAGFALFWSVTAPYRPRRVLIDKEIHD